MLTLVDMTDARAAEIRAEVQAILDAPGRWKTRQELFDGTVRHLAAQGRQATAPVGHGSRCVMRNDVGDKCAIGCHIRDEDYKPWMDATSGALCAIGGGNQVREATWKVAGVAPEDADLGLLLQTVHDNNSQYVWEEAFRTICLEKDLDAAVFDEPAVAAGFKAIRARFS